MARPNSRKTDSPAKVRIPPISHSMILMPTEPVDANMPDGVEKTIVCQ